MLAAWQPPGDYGFFKGDGVYGQIRGGAKALFSPRGRGHVTARAGAVWLRSTAANEFLDNTPGDYVGGYAGVGYEFDLNSRIRTGPELTVMGVARESSATFEFVPQLNWHVIWNL